jgi:thiamine pyrophosphate-dependent acetolactate synthase large subunit-like protein
MAHTTASILIETLRDWGVRVVFGLAGGGITVAARGPCRGIAMGVALRAQAGMSRPKGRGRR